MALEYQLEVGISYTDGEPTGWLDVELAGTAAPTALTLRVDPEGLESPVAFDGVVEITSFSAPGSRGDVRTDERHGSVTGLAAVPASAGVATLEVTGDGAGSVALVEVTSLLLPGESRTVEVVFQVSSGRGTSP